MGARMSEMSYYQPYPSRWEQWRLINRSFSPQLTSIRCQGNNAQLMRQSRNCVSYFADHGSHSIGLIDTLARCQVKIRWDEGKGSREIVRLC